MSPILARLALAVLIALAGWLAFRAVNRIVLTRRARRGLGLPEFRAGTPAVILFTSPDCRPCRTIQRPALERLAQVLEQGLQIIEIDVYERPDLAESWGVLSLPTTFLIDSVGRPRHVNHGVAREPKLIAQLAQIGELPPDIDLLGVPGLAIKAD